MSTILIKIGTNSIVNKEMKVEKKTIRRLIKQVKILKKSGYRVVLVASGAVAFGRIAFADKSENLTFQEKQIMASVGQVSMFSMYEKICKKNGLTLSQILFRKSDFSSKECLENLSSVLNGVLSLPALIPIINENDVMKHEQNRFRDNDELTDYIAKIIKPIHTIFLTSVDGVYKNSDLVKKNIIKKFSKNHISAVKFFSSTALGTGGMKNKIESAISIAELGGKVSIYNASKKNCLLNVLAYPDKFGTIILPD